MAPNAELITRLRLIQGNRPKPSVPEYVIRHVGSGLWWNGEDWSQTNALPFEFHISALAYAIRMGLALTSFTVEAI